jgi:DHA1 family bicyclomycin/chloramphenicol resistance-like MFS transporter
VSPEAFAWIFGLNASGLIAASQVNRRLLARYPPARIALTAMLFCALVGAVLVGLALTGAGGVAAIIACLFLFLTGTGFVSPNATALALEEHGQRAGIASAVLGSAQFAVSAGASSLVGLLNDGSMLPMAAMMAACAGAAWAVGVAASRRTVPGEPRLA